jgi:hypothetical protein
MDSNHISLGGTMTLKFALAFVLAGPAMAQACDLSPILADIQRAVAQGDAATGARLGRLAIEMAVACAQAPK